MVSWWVVADLVWVVGGGLGGAGKSVAGFDGAGGS